MERARWLLLRWGTLAVLWVRRRFTPAGWVVLSLLALSALVGFDTYKNLAYQIFTLASALVLLALPFEFFFRPRLSVRRTLPRFGTAGEGLPYALEAESSRGSPALTLTEVLPAALPGYEEFRTAAGGYWFDRWTGVSRWLGLLEKARGASAVPMNLPALRPGSSAQAEGRLVPAGRGRVVLPGLEAWRADPLGLFNARAFLSAPQSVLVLPRRYPVPRVELSGKRRYQQGGVSLSSSVGESQEFVSLRDYRPGDPLRKLHWKSLAKTGKLIVKEYQDEYFVRHALALDTFGAGDPEVFEEAVSAAASFACSVLTQESLLDLLFVGAETYCFTAGRNLGGPERLLEVLACVGPCRERPFSVLESAVLRRSASLSGVLLVLLGLDDERRRFLARLRGLGIPVLACAVGRGAPEAGVHWLEPGRMAEGLARLA